MCTYITYFLHSFLLSSPQDTEHGSLRSYQLSVLYMYRQGAHLNPSLPVHHTPPFSLGIHIFVPYVCVSISALQVRSSILSFKNINQILLPSADHPILDRHYPSASLSFHPGFSQANSPGSSFCSTLEPTNLIQRLRQLLPLLAGLSPCTSSGSISLSH